MRGYRSWLPILRHRPGPKVREHVRDIVRLAQRDAVMAQDRIRGDRVEIELRQRPVAQVLRARHVEHRAVGQLERDRPLGAFVERVRRQPGEQGARIGEAGLRIAQRAGRGVRLPSRAPHLQQRFGKRVAAQAIDGLLRLKGRCAASANISAASRFVGTSSGSAPNARWCAAALSSHADKLCSMCVNVGTSSAVGDMSDLRKVSCVNDTSERRRTACAGDRR
ncbi:hypothetical protein DP44_5876 [Burkholderia pseudomallei]|nr:hypothetical protein DP44_5876 [Burkholderia pseudomallei]